MNVSNAHRAYRKLSTYEQGSAHIENSNCREGVASDSIYTTLDERVYIDALPREPKRMTMIPTVVQWSDRRLTMETRLQRLKRIAELTHLVSVVRYLLLMLRNLSI